MATLWNGDMISDSLMTEIGVKQKCILGSVLVELFFYDLDKFFGVGVNEESGSAFF